MSNKHHLNTKLIHAGEPEERYGGAVSMPIFQSSTFEFDGETNYNDLLCTDILNDPYNYEYEYYEECVNASIYIYFPVFAYSINLNKIVSLVIGI